MCVIREFRKGPAIQLNWGLYIANYVESQPYGAFYWVAKAKILYLHPLEFWEVYKEDAYQQIASIRGNLFGS